LWEVWRGRTVQEEGIEKRDWDGDPENEVADVAEKLGKVDLEDVEK
jgi:hypothetical protein